MPQVAVPRRAGPAPPIAPDLDADASLHAAGAGAPWRRAYLDLTMLAHAPRLDEMDCALCAALSAEETLRPPPRPRPRVRRGLRAVPPPTR